MRDDREVRAQVRAARQERPDRHYSGKAMLCYHDPGREVPPADVTVAQLLWLRTDEPSLLAMAHVQPVESSSARIRRWIATPGPEPLPWDVAPA